MQAAPISTNPAIPSPPKPRLSREVLEGFSKILAFHLGLDFPFERSGELERGALLAAQMFGFTDAEKCLAWISSSPPSRGKTQTLARAFTVGETFFFRGKPCFSALEERVLPALIAAGRAKGKRLRIWSAGCCTGEEPYSISILLHRLLPDWEDWNISILATDINPEFLDKAREGLYNHWSFRNVEDSRKTDFFRATPQGLLELVPKIKRSVNFAYSNLATGPPLVLFKHDYGLDLIVCRNVIMYLTDQCARKVTADFFQLLEEGGWLIAGPSDGPSTLFSQFAVRSFPNVIFHQKPPLRQNTGCDVETSDSPRIQEERAFKPPTQQQRIFLPEKQVSALSTYQSSDDYSSLILSVRNFGNEGNLVAALNSCNLALKLHRLDPTLHYLRALILQEAGKASEAAKSLERGLYLDPGFVMAHYAMGNLALRRGEREKSNRHFKNAICLLKDLPEEQPLPESDGVSAGRLRHILGTLVKGKARQK